MYSATKEELKNTAQNLRSDIANTGEAVKSDLRVVAHDAGHKVREMLSTASDEISHISDKVTKQINDKPVQSSLTALGLGVLLGILFRR